MYIFHSLKQNMVRKSSQRSLSEDLQPLMRLLQLSGHFMPEYEKGSSVAKAFYSLIHISLGVLHFVFIVIKLLLQFGNTVALISNTLTMLFFLHGITKVLYFAVKRKQFYATMRSWDVSHSHPLFLSSDNKHRYIFTTETKRLLRPVLLTTGLTIFLWAIHPFVDEAGVVSAPQAATAASTLEVAATELTLSSTEIVELSTSAIITTQILSTTTTETVDSNLLNFTNVEPEMEFDSLTAQPEALGRSAKSVMKVTKLLINAWYPWNPYGSTFAFVLTYMYQLYWLVFCICQINLLDTLFCSWLIYGCEQLRHLKESMHVMMQLSASDGVSMLSSDNNRDFIVENQDEIMPTAPTKIFQRVRRLVPNEQTVPVAIRLKDTKDSLFVRLPPAHMDMEVNVESGQHSSIIRSAIKYWVERHKHILVYVESIGDSYGMALLLHMLTSTVILTLLSYEATKITGLTLHAFVVISYLSYTLAQVFLFCLYGNRLIEESVSVMHATYSCPWYDGSEEAKTFVQIVCQQCQRPLSVSGAKFFTVSLDLFASVLGAVVTYFMVLIQLN